MFVPRCHCFTARHVKSTERNEASLLNTPDRGMWGEAGNVTVQPFTDFSGRKLLLQFKRISHSAACSHFNLIFDTVTKFHHESSSSSCCQSEAEDRAEWTGSSTAEVMSINLISIISFSPMINSENKSKVSKLTTFSSIQKYSWNYKTLHNEVLGRSKVIGSQLNFSPSPDVKVT